MPQQSDISVTLGNQAALSRLFEGDLEVWAIQGDGDCRGATRLGLVGGEDTSHVG